MSTTEVAPATAKIAAKAAMTVKAAEALERAGLSNTVESLTSEQFDRAVSAKPGLSGKSLSAYILTGQTAAQQIAASKTAEKAKTAAAKTAAKAEAEKAPRADRRYKIQYFGARGKGWVFYGQRKNVELAMATIERRRSLFDERIWRVLDSQATDPKKEVVFSDKLSPAAKALASAK
jgi:hypothetical protein